MTTFFLYDQVIKLRFRCRNNSKETLRVQAGRHQAQLSLQLMQQGNG